MIVVSEIILKELMAQIVGATHGLMDSVGNPRTVSTIPEDRLETAALVALHIAIGKTVWPQNDPIIIRRPERNYGIFREEV